MGSSSSPWVPLVFAWRWPLMIETTLASALSGSASRELASERAAVRTPPGARTMWRKDSAAMISALQPQRVLRTCHG